LIDLPALGERSVGWQGGGAWCNGKPVHASAREKLGQAVVAHGDPYCFDMFGERSAWERLAREVPILRGYSDCFGHAMTVRGAVDAMVDLSMNPWDAAATRILVTEAGGRCALLDRGDVDFALGLVFGSPPLVEQLLDYLSGSLPVRG
jgi:myo-inositol-1(or 4)-monophosphatase